MIKKQTCYTCISHVRVYTALSVPSRTSAASTCNGFIVSHCRISKREVVHTPFVSRKEASKVLFKNVSKINKEKKKRKYSETKGDGKEKEYLNRTR